MIFLTNMNATELTAALAQQLQLPKTDIAKRLDDTAAIITEELTKGSSLSFSTFGSLEVKKREERISVHPVSGKRMLVPPKLVVKFKISNPLKDRLKEMKI